MNKKTPINRRLRRQLDHLTPYEIFAEEKPVTLHVKIQKMIFMKHA